MISIEMFLRILEEAIRREPNDGQRKAIEAAQSASLFIVAGPGTGKTATLTVRMLKLIFVDGLSPPRHSRYNVYQEGGSRTLPPLAELGVLGPGVSAEQREAGPRWTDSGWMVRHQPGVSRHCTPKTLRRYLSVRECTKLSIAGDRDTTPDRAGTVLRVLFISLYEASHIVARQRLSHGH